MALWNLFVAFGVSPAAAGPTAPGASGLMTSAMVSGIVPACAVLEYLIRDLGRPRIVVAYG